ncbi:hypothetical protein CR513_27360, partial [Mucuna pruriens]
MYETVLSDLGVTLPFDYFEADVLRILGIAPSQLHPNGWAAIQAFKVVCLTLGLLPTALVFLSHYTTRVGQSMGWVSLTPLPNTGLFTSYTASYKGFKSRFVKIQASEASHFCVDPRPLPLLGLVPKMLICCFFGLQGVDMAKLIKKARLTNNARSTGRKATDAVTATIATEKKWAAGCGLGREVLSPCGGETNGTGRVWHGGGQAKCWVYYGRGGDCQEGESYCSPPPPLPIQSKSKVVVVTSGSDLPLGGLSCYVAPPTTNSLWGPGFDIRGLFPTSRIPQHDRGLLVSTGTDNSIDMMTAYMARSMASLEVWRGLVRKAKQIVAKETINKKELEKA